MTTFEVLGVNDSGDTVWLLVDEGCGPDWVESRNFVTEQEAWELIRLAAGDLENGLAVIEELIAALAA